MGENEASLPNKIAFLFIESLAKSDKSVTKGHKSELLFCFPGAFPLVFCFQTSFSVIFSFSTGFSFSMLFGLKSGHKMEKQQ